jgi:hypothetical protein
MSEPADQMICVWRFNDAPQEWRDLSQHGGDEDWLAVVPATMRDAYIPWLDYGSFGVCDISRHELPDGRIVFIGAHA